MDGWIGVDCPYVGSEEKNTVVSSVLFPFLFYLGLSDSSILRNNMLHLTSLSKWLKSVVQGQSSVWKRCWRASADGWAASTFHSHCDNNGPTVTIVKVGNYIFGGYTSLSWGK